MHPRFARLRERHASEVSEGRAAGLSERGVNFTFPSLSYLDEFLRAATDRYDQVSNPDGSCCLCVAENRLSFKAADGGASIQGWLHDPAHRRAVPENPWAHYDDFAGCAEFRDNLASFLSSHFTSIRIASADVVVGTGAGAVLEMLFTSIAAAGDAVLVPAPYYAAFENDLSIRAGLFVVPVTTKAPHFAVTTAALDAAAAAAERDGRRVAAVLLTSPHNPTGVIYSAGALREVNAWCAARERCHLVSDEIYALSVHSAAEGERFVSVAEVCEGALGDFVHVVYGMSKDFCSSGFRVGVLITQNEALKRALATLGYFHGISQLAQHALAPLLVDSEFLAAYFAANQRRLARQLAVVRELARSLPGASSTGGVNEAKAGLFCWLDLRRFLKSPTFEGERQLFAELARDCKVVLTPGKDCAAEEPGFFRCCFAASSEAELREAFLRMKTHFLAERESSIILT